RGWLPAALAFVAVVAADCDVAPYWGSAAYFNCLAHALHRPFNLFDFRCVGHPSIVYLLLLGLPPSLAPWQPVIVWGVNAMLGVASIAAFHDVLRRLFPAQSGLERGFATALYALAPLFVAHALVVNLDYGMTAFFVLLLDSLLARRFW